MSGFGGRHLAMMGIAYAARRTLMAIGSGVLIAGAAIAGTPAGGVGVPRGERAPASVGAAHDSTRVDSRRGARGLLREGVELYRSGLIEDSLELFARASQADPGIVQSLYNEACAMYRLGRLDEAEHLFRSVEASPRAGDLAARSAYNSGLIAFERAQTLPADGTEPDLEVVLEQLNRAESAFRSALDMDAQDADAAQNLELTRYAIHRVRELMRQQEEMRRQQEELARQMQELAEELGELEQMQREAARASADAAAEREEQSGDESERADTDRNEESPSPLGEYQRELIERTRQAQEKLDRLREQMRSGASDEPSAQSPADRASEYLSEAQRRQKHALQELAKGEPRIAESEQHGAADELRRALEQIAQEQERQSRSEASDGGEQGEPESSEEEREPSNESSQDSASEPKEGEDGAGNGDEAQQEPRDQLVEALLDKEKRDRERRDAALRERFGRFRPVEKDW